MPAASSKYDTGFCLVKSTRSDFADPHIAHKAKRTAWQTLFVGSKTDVSSGTEEKIPRGLGTVLSQTKNEVPSMSNVSSHPLCVKSSLQIRILLRDLCISVEEKEPAVSSEEADVIRGLGIDRVLPTLGAERDLFDPLATPGKEFP
jgi:hypothetical protein